MAERYAAKVVEPLTFTPLHRLELRTALRGRVYRKTLTPDKLKEALQKNVDQLSDGFLRHVSMPWAEALREAERIGELHVAETGVRTGDLLHVASAVALRAQEFVSFDQRQTELARRVGLKVRLWKFD